MGGIKAYSIDGQTTQLSETGVVLEAVMPLGPGTVYHVFGSVQLLGNTIHSDGDAPLVFVVHNTNGDDEAKAKWKTKGDLDGILFRFLEETETSDMQNQSDSDVVLQLVHITGTGGATLKDGRQLTFR